jgi:hypothetical protein
MLAFMRCQMKDRSDYNEGGFEPPEQSRDDGNCDGSLSLEKFEIAHLEGLQSLCSIAPIKIDRQQITLNLLG